MKSILDELKASFANTRQDILSLQEYVDGLESTPEFHATIAERLLKAIGEPRIFDTSKDERMGRIFLNKTIKVYDSFKDFYGIEDVIERIVNFLTYASQGLEERKQILYLLGPVGGGKSSLAEYIKILAEKEPIYVLATDKEISPIFESPLGLFYSPEYRDRLPIPSRKVPSFCSPWAAKRLHEFGGDINKFKVIKLYPSRLSQICVAKTEPGDENNQDISSLVGKIDVRKLERFPQHDVDAYGFSGALNRTTQGVMEFVEMFKAPIKMLHPLLTATQEGNYVGTENIGAIPFQGLILSHSNIAEFSLFRNNKNNEAFLDRMCVIKVPYCLRATEEEKIYEKLIKNSDLRNATCAPKTLRMLAEFAVLSRLAPPDGQSSVYSKMEVYDGKSIKDIDLKAKSILEYKESAPQDEGMDGVSTRFAFKILSDTFNFDPKEIAADPVHLMTVVENHIERSDLPESRRKELTVLLKDRLGHKYAEFIGHEIQRAYLESYKDYGQNIFDKYVDYADAWIEDQDYKDPDTGQLVNRAALDAELSKIEKIAEIGNPKDFRNEVVKFVLRYRSANKGKNPSWDSYKKMADVIEKRMFSSIQDLLPVISFGTKKDSQTESKHVEFVKRMVARGYTENQVRRLIDWYSRVTFAA